MPHRQSNAPRSAITNDSKNTSSSTSGSAQYLIGQWVDDQTANPSDITITRNGDDIVMVKVFRDGTKERYELAATEVDGQTRYYLKRSNTDRYCYVDSNGDLAWADDGRIWMTTPSKQTAKKAAELARKQAEKQRLAKEEMVRKEEEQTLLQKNLDAYIAALEAAKAKVVRNVEVKQRGDIWTATLTVSNVWHLKLYQVRLQDAQALWEVWARIASPKEPDKARISIVDLRGNEVGGSRFLAGSLIWVQEQ
jgi:hypothetical protein